jgi:bidirectional [NiFe] hydrogenase diaphorase subunit
MAVARVVVPPHPTSDKRYKMLDATIKRHQAQPDSLLEVLHNAQELFGYLEDNLLIYVGRSLKVPLARVYGVATFYNFFSLKPKGEHTCVVCMGTACYVKGAGEVVGAIEKEFGIKVGETTNDNKISLMTARCVGSCGLAPAVVFDGSVEGHVSCECAVKRLKGWTHE